MLSIPYNRPKDVQPCAGLFVLVDCNNFYVSCERVFQPFLENKPVVVLSNNDGCVIARSNEAKQLGIKMGEPAFKIKDFFKKHDVRVYSSNYALYGDMSNRVMTTLLEFTPQMEIYSQDEAFLYFSGRWSFDLEGYARQVQAAVKRRTGIPVSIGLARTKTLAKLANKLAKKDISCQGVLNLESCGNREGLLKQINVEDVWGIGPRYAKFLKKHMVYTAYELRELPERWVKKHLTVAGLHTVLELRGIPCIDLEEVPPPAKSLVRSRSFSRPVTDIRELREALATHVQRAGEKLRSTGQEARFIHVFLRTNPHKPEPQHCPVQVKSLRVPTNQTPILLRCALQLLDEIYRPGYAYKKAGVLLSGLVQEKKRQRTLYELQDMEVCSSWKKLMQVMDSINSRYGRDTVQFAACGTEKAWDIKRRHMSQAFSTKWEEIPVVRAF